MKVGERTAQSAAVPLRAAEAQTAVRKEGTRRSVPEATITGAEETVPRAVVRMEEVRTARATTARIAETVPREAVRTEEAETVRPTIGIITARIVQTITAGIGPRGTARTEEAVIVRADTAIAAGMTVLRAAVRTAGADRAEGIPSAVR